MGSCSHGGEMGWGTSPQPFWRSGPVSGKIQAGRGRMGWGWFKHIVFIMHFIHIIIGLWYNEIIIQLTIMQNQWEPWACFPATRWSHLRMPGDKDTWSVLLMSSLPCHLLVTVTAENPASSKDRLSETEAGFSVLLWQSQAILPWF